MALFCLVTEDDEKLILKKKKKAALHLSTDNVIFNI